MSAIKVKTETVTTYTVGHKSFPSQKAAQQYLEQKQWDEWMDAIISPLEFTAHEDHVALLKTAYVDWFHC
jgi:hypothetical protein